jgi:hypothetical protein
VNANACWEKTQQEGGTLDAISEIVHLGSIGVKCKVRDLFTGEVVKEESLNDITPGTYVFWSCLDVVLKSDPASIRKAALVMISEPGKARTVTKASAALKIVLDVVNKICSWPLSKIESSKSGMGRSSHAWNSFKSAFTPEGKEYAFNISREEIKKESDGSYLVTRHYRDLWMSSTDYEEATDSMNHEVARMISKYWMDKCGIPPVLQMIVNGTCFMPREIVFEAYGSMANYGIEWNHESPFKKPRYVTLVKGVLMGDPLTKVILHLVNILVRITGANYADANFIEKIFPLESREVREYLKDYSPSSLAESSLTPEKLHAPTGDVKSFFVGSGIDAGTTSVTHPVPPDALPLPKALLKKQEHKAELPPSFHFNLAESLRRTKAQASSAESLHVSSQSLKEMQIRLSGSEQRHFNFQNFRIAALLRETKRAQEAETALLAQRAEQLRLQKLVQNWKPIPVSNRNKEIPKPVEKVKGKSTGCLPPFRALFYKD